MDCHPVLTQPIIVNNSGTYLLLLSIIHFAYASIRVDEAVCCYWWSQVDMDAQESSLL